MNAFTKSALTLTALGFSTLAIAQVTFYERESFQGRSFTAQGQVESLSGTGFNDRASSAIVERDSWEVCEDTRYGGRCAILRPGRYSSLSSMGLDNRISSVRYVSRGERGDNNAPAPVAERDYRRRSEERVYEANVTSVRAVVGAAEQRCWMEPGPAPQQRSGMNVPGTVVGAIVGGILGHQIGHGTTRDVATVGGAVAGGYVGNKVGSGMQAQSEPQNVQRCENVSSDTQPNYWDVTYNFRGEEHRVQMTTRPGSTVIVNEQGEPRV